MKTHSIAVGIIQFEDKVLILKRAKTRKYSPNLWEFVSGLIKEKESAEEAVLREVKEETNLDGEIIKSGKSFETVDKWGRWIIIPFLISVKSNKVKIGKEHSEYKWINPEEIDNFETVVDVRKDLESLGFLIGEQNDR